MSDEVNVIQRTQLIIVEPSSGSVAIINAGPQGPAGPVGPASSAYVLQVALSDPNGSAIITNTSVATLRIPATLNGKNLSGVAMLCTTPSSSGVVTVDINRSRRATATSRTTVSVLSTKLTVDATEYDSIDATPAVINVANDDVVTGDAYLFDIDTAGTGCKGLLVELTFS